MQAQELESARGLYGMGTAVDKTNRKMDDMRRAFGNVVNSAREYEVRQVKSISLAEDYAKQLKDQKVHLFNAIKNRKLLMQVIKDQIALENAQAVSWRKDASGRTTADLIMPREGIRAIDNARVSFGVLNQAIASGADNMVKWGKNTQWAGRQLTVGFSVPLGMAAAATGKLAYEMDQSLTNITKVYGDATTQFQDSTKTIRDTAMQTATNMAAVYGQSAKDTLEIEAQFAAAGKTGVELQQATAAATKARMLNEIDLQTAIQASITMQTVYGYTAEELGQKWDYINAVANQTVLGAEDFAVAIPKVSGVLKEMGASLEDVGVLMTAFKSAGIDAAEGANALKTISFRAVSAYGKGLKTFTEMTGQDLKQIVNQTNGETIPTLLAMYKAMENLSTPQKIAVVKDVFGIYQGNKALILLEQLASQSEQVAQAMAVGKNSIAENAAIANQELARMNAQPFKRIQKAIESIKIQMAQLGQAVLPIAASFLSGVEGIMKWVNGLDQGTKKAALLIATAVGLAGPLTMLLGLFANLGGNVIKMFAAFGNLITRYKIVDAQERAQVLLAKQAENAWDTQTSAIARLVQELQIYNKTMAETIALQRGEQATTAAVRPASLGTGDGISTISKKDKAGRWQHFQVDAEGRSKRISAERLAALKQEQMALGQVQQQEAARLAVLQEQALVMDAQRTKLLGMSRNIGMGIAGAGMIGTLFGGNATVQTISGISMAAGSLLSMFPSIGVSIAKNLVAPFKLFGPTAVNSLKNAGQAVLGFARSMAGPLAIALAGVLIYWQKVSAAQDEALKKAEAYQNSAKALGELTGVNWNDGTGLPEATKTAEQSTQQAAQKFREQFRAEADALAASGAETGDRWGIAIAKGVQVRLHGGTVDAAKQATRTALAIMGENLDDKTFTVNIDAKVDFNNINSLISQTVANTQRELNRAINDKGSGAERYNRDQGLVGGLFKSGQNDLTGAARSNATKAGEEFYNALLGIPDPGARKKAYDDFVRTNVTELQNMYNELVQKRDASVMKNFDKSGKSGAVGFNAFLKDMQIKDGGLKYGLNMSDEDVARTQRMAEAIGAITQGMAQSTGKFSDSQINQFFDPQKLEPYLKTLFQIEDASGKVTSNEVMTKVMADYGNAVDRATQSGRVLTEEEKLGMYNRARAAQGLQYATSMSEAYAYQQQQVADATSKNAQAQLNLADAMKQVNLNPTITEDMVRSQYRSVMEATNNDLVSAANDSLQREADVAAKALDNQMDTAMKVFDDKSDALDKKYDEREKALSKRHDAETDALAKKQDDRKKRESAYYDNRIKGVQALIDAEQAAEDQRQKIFEAEKARIERMAEMYNKNIDFNSALNTGNLDEAAKISNDMRAQNETWMTQDTAAASQSTSDARVEQLNKQKDSIDAAKQARLDALDEIDKREKQALQDRQQRETDALKTEQDNAKKRLDIQKDAARKYWEDQKATNQAVWQDRQRKLQLELDTIRAYIPRNKAELDKQAADINKAYLKYGVQLKGYGDDWSKYVGSSMNRNVAASANALKTEVNWANIGQVISDGLIKGGFGMTAKQFATWLNGGSAPNGTLFSPNTKQGKPRYATGNYGGGGLTKDSHTGSIVGKTDGKRTGWSGERGTGSEQWVNVLKGQGILTRKATDMLGEENIMALNKGKLPKNTGPWGMAGVGAALAAGATKRIMGQVLQTVVERKMAMDALMGGLTGGGAGKNGMTGFDAFMAAIAGQESGGNYGAVNATSGALGKYQVMPNNVNAWGKKYLGINITPAQFLASGELQERLVRAVLGSYYSKYGPRGAASAWYSGDPTLDMDTRSQAGYPSIKDYVDSVMSKMGKIAPGNLGSEYAGFGAGINMSQYGAGAVGSGPGGWVMPAVGPVTSRYGMRINPVTGQYKLHAGSDIAAASGSPIYAARAGRVISAGPVSGYGNYTIIDHGNGIRTAYAHQSRIGVTPGQLVTAGQRIGFVGSTGNSTGPHLHFEYMKNGQRVNPHEILPSLNTGGWTMSDGLAKLHQDEAVLTKPLSANLKEGINRFAEGDDIGYNITMDFRGAHFASNVDVEQAVESALQKKERRVGVKRKIGGK